MRFAAIHASQGSVPDVTAPGTGARPSPWLRRLYIGAVTTGGAYFIVTRWPVDIPNPSLALGLVAASVLLSVFKLRLPLGRNVSTMSMACAADLTALMAMGPDLAMLTASAGVLAQCTIRVRRRQPLHRAAFSVAAVAVTAQVAGLVWQQLDGRLDAAWTLALPLAATTLTYFAVNTGLVATAIGLSTGVAFRRVWYRDFFWSGPSYLLSGAAAAVVGLIVVNGAFVLLPIAFIPIYISYRAYQLSLARIDEERRHARELAEMVATAQQALVRASESERALVAEKERLVLETARLNATVQTITDGVMMVDRHGAILLMNDEARRIAALAPDWHRRRPIIAVLGSLGFDIPAHQDALQRLWNEGHPIRLVNEAPGDGSRPHVEVTGTCTRDADGEVAGIVWVLRDITAITRAEQERAKAAHLESIGVLAGGLAHDFNNILMGIVGNLSLAQRKLPPGDARLQTWIGHALAACARARGVTSQLLTFAKGGAPIKTAASIRELVIECTRFVLSGSAIAARFDIADDLWIADVDANQFSQVVHNMVLNAVQAMPGGGVIDVAIDNARVATPPVAGDRPLAPGRYVRLTFRDHGSGIAAEHRDRIFDPYFTTKEKGSGLGLATSYSIVRAHGGEIVVESPPDGGAKFTVYVPASSRPAVTDAPGVAPLVRTAGGRALLMDDDTMVAEVAQEMLESVGYEVEVTASGEQAIARFADAERAGTPFHLVILDLTVPGGLGGADTVAPIRALRPDVTIFVSSGYADDGVLGRFRDFGFDGVIPKPFTLTELRQAVGTVQAGTRQPAADATTAG